MNQEELIEVINIYQKMNWMDWISIIVSIVSPIIMFISVIIAWKATKISKETAELNLKMYQKQIEDNERSYLPIFEVQTDFLSLDTVRLKLNNKNNNSISITNIAYEESIIRFQEKRINDNEIKMQFLGNFKEHDRIKVWLYYTALNHKQFSSEIIFRIVEQSLVIESNKIKDRN